MGMLFGHSGDLGDIVYSLPTLRAQGGGAMYLMHTPGRTREAMTPERAGQIVPLLERQSYIESASFAEERFDSNLDGFRNHYQHGNLADMHLATYGLGWEHRVHRWIEADPFRAAPVIVSRSHRYRNANFPWRQIVEEYKGRIGFVGTAAEHESFCLESGEVPHVTTPTLMDAANVIAGCDLFVGNQSCCAAIAEGLKHRMILEVCPSPNNCIFERPGRINLWDQKCEFPRVGSDRPGDLSGAWLCRPRGQCGEDEWVHKHLPLPSKGVFVDVGAGDGETTSNTLMFEQMGWDGLLIEPDPRVLPALYRSRRAQVLPYAVAAERGFVRFGLTPDQLASGILRTDAPEFLDIPAIPLADALDRAGIGKIDLLSIDVEGTELDVWRSFEHRRHSPTVVIIEFDTIRMPPRDVEVLAELGACGYREVHRTQFNQIFHKVGA